MEGRVERGWPRVGVGIGGKGGARPGEGGAAFVDFLGGGVADRDTRVGEELRLLRFSRERDLRRSAEFAESVVGRHGSSYAGGSSRRQRRGPGGRVK